MTAVILLLGVLLPAQQVFACDVMGGQAKAACCCSDQVADSNCASGSCGHDAQVPLGENGCCNVSLSEPAVYTSQQVVNHAIGVNELVEPPQPPPFIGLSDRLAVNTILFSTTPIADFQYQPAGHQTYLNTQRLRL